MNDDEFIPTRRTLLSRLKNWNDQESWKEFFETYARLIYSVAAKAGLTDAEAQDVVQETVIIVARKDVSCGFLPKPKFLLRADSCEFVSIRGSGPCHSGKSRL